MKKPAFRRHPLIEELEPRLLFSADLAPFAVEGFQQHTEHRVLNTTGEFAGTASAVRQELVIVDSGVEDYQTLLNDILGQADGNRRIEVIVLDANRDGLEQISEILRQQHDLDALHLISHGDSGMLRLGSGTLDSAAMQSNAADVAAWKTAFSERADILLYGCDVASGSGGEEFIGTLSQLTGTDVAASTDRTGSQAGSDWVLEKQAGAIETGMLLGPLQTAWRGVLDIDANASQVPVNETTSNDQLTSPSSKQIALHSDGSFVVVWTSHNQDGGGDGVYARQFDAGGNPLTGEIQVNTTTSDEQTAPVIAMDAGGNFVVVWQAKGQESGGGGGWGIYAQRFDASGNKLGGEFLVNTTVTNNQTSPSIGMDAAGNFVVAWESQNQDGDGLGIYAQRFDNLGNKIQTAGQNQFRVNSENEKDQYQPAVAMNASGAFVIVWTSEDQNTNLFGGHNDGIYARLFDAGGATIKSEFNVYPLGSLDFGNQYQPDVAMNDDGHFVVVLTDDAQGNPNVSAFVFDASGNRQGFGTQVNQYSTGIQQNASVAINSAGEFIVAWESQNQDGDIYGVVARHFKADYSAYEAEQIINLVTVGSQAAPGIAWRGSEAVFIWSGKGTEDSHGVYFRQASIGTENAPPAITSNGGGDTALVEIAENTTVVTTVTATDAEFEPITYTINGGADAALFDIDSVTGELCFVSPPDFEAHADADADNVYEVSVLATDEAGGTDSQTIRVTVSDEDEAPLGVDDSYALSQDSTLVVDTGSGVLANDSDPEGASLTVTGVVSMTAHGNGTLHPDGSFDYTPDAGYTGTDSFSYSFTDGNGHTSVATVFLNVNLNNQAPTSTPVTLVPIDEDSGPRTITQAELLANASDPNPGDTLIASGLSISSGMGTLVNNGDGTWTYTPAANDDTQVSFSYTVSDGGQTTSGNASLDFTPVNDDPQGVNDTITTNEDAPVTIDVVGNDTDPENDGLTVIAVTDGTNGTVSFAGGSVTYTPNADFHGDDNFSYTVSDGNGGTDTAIVYVTVNAVNDAPAGSDGEVSVDEDGVYTFRISDFGFTDTNDTPSNGLQWVKITTLPAAGTLLYEGSPVVVGQMIGAADIGWNELQFVPAAHASGVGYTSFTFQVQDDGGTAIGGVNLDQSPNTLSINVTPVNDAPIASGTAVLASIQEDDTNPPGDTVASLFAGNFSNPEDAGTLSQNQFAGVAVRGQSVNPSQGRWQYSTDAGATWSNFGFISDASAVSLGLNDRLRFLPAADYHGSPNNLSVRLLDNSASVTGGAAIDASANGGTTAISSATVPLSTEVQPVNDAPVLVIGALKIDQGETVVLDGSILQASDADNTSNELTYVVTAQPAKGKLALNGTALKINDSFTQADIDAGRVTYTHTSAKASKDSLGIKLIDPSGAEVSGTLSITVQPSATNPVEPGTPAPKPDTKPPSIDPEPEAGDAGTPDAETDTPPLSGDNGEVADSGDSSIAGTANGFVEAYQAAGKLSPVQVIINGSLLPNEAQAPTPLLVTLNRALEAIAGDLNALESLKTSLDNSSFQRQLNQLQNEIRMHLSLDKNTVASSLAVSTSLSVGYVLWLVRGGVLLSSLLSSLPAWRLIDPLPILGHLNREKKGDDEDDSLEGMLKKSAKNRNLDKDRSAP